MLNSKELAQLKALLAKSVLAQSNEIAKIFNEDRRMKVNSVKMSFAVGQNVKWDGKRGDMSGIITKINPKYIVVNAGSAGKWNASPQLLIAA